MSYVSIDEIYRAALELKEKEEIPNRTQIARFLKIKRRQLSYLLQEKYLGVASFDTAVVRSKGKDFLQPKTFKSIRICVETIRTEGLLPSPRALAKRLGWRLKRLQRYLREHPTLERELSLYTDDESLVWEGAKQIMRRGEKVTRIGLAQEIGRHYRTVNRILKKHPRWYGELGICNSPRNSGVYKLLYTHKTRP